MRALSLVAAILAAFMFTSSQPARALASGENAAASETAAAAYCERTGGKVEYRIPEYGTNGSQPLVLSGHHNFCLYTASDHSHIHLFLETLYTKLPSLAALAYYAQVQPGQCNGNPASCYCTLLGGSDQFGGTTGNGGAWVSKSKIDTDLEACIFPDLSSIDSWGLLYHSQGIIRGIDLSTVLRYANPYAKKQSGQKNRTTPFQV